MISIAINISIPIMIDIIFSFIVSPYDVKTSTYAPETKCTYAQYDDYCDDVNYNTFTVIKFSVALFFVFT